MDLELDFVRSLIKLMSEHNMTEMSLEEGEQKIHLLRGQSSSESKVTQVSTVIPAMMPGMPITIPTVANTMPAVVPMAAAAPELDNSIQIVKSPMVGTFYRSPTPDSDPFVDTGDVVREDTQLAIIEAMKVMNEITAEVSGEIVEILVANAEAVEYDQPLFHIRKID
jgi:acetyl-CoA carboxylase biotin carboxyl carrier protein